MAPVLWLLLGGAAGALITAKTATVVGRGLVLGGAGAALAAVSAIRKRLSPQAQAEFDAAFAGLTPEQVLAVINSEHDPDAMRIAQIAQQHLAHRDQWLAMFRAPPRTAATAGAWMEGRHHGGMHHHGGHPGYGMGQAPPPPRMNTWKRWQAAHPGTSHQDYRNWVTQYGQYGATIR